MQMNTTGIVPCQLQRSPCSSCVVVFFTFMRLLLLVEVCDNVGSVGLSSEPVSQSPGRSYLRSSQTAQGTTDSEGRGNSAQANGTPLDAKRQRSGSYAGHEDRKETTIEAPKTHAENNNNTTTCTSCLHRLTSSGEILNPTSSKCPNYGEIMNFTISDCRNDGQIIDHIRSDCSNRREILNLIYSNCTNRSDIISHVCSNCPNWRGILNLTSPGLQQSSHSQTTTSTGFDDVTRSPGETKATPVSPWQSRGTPPKVRPKSQTYIRLKQSLPTFSGKNTRSCKNMCDNSRECSCKPICIYLKTCCVDFLDYCSDVYNMSKVRENFQWLESAGTECKAHTIMVTTCSRIKGQSVETYKNSRVPERSEIYTSDFYDNLANNASDFHDNLANNASDFSSHVNSSWSNANQTGNDKAGRNLTLMDVVRHLTSVSPDEMVHLSEAEQMLVSVPVLDLSMGITFRNLSIYHCNGADLRQAKFWSFSHPVQYDHYLVYPEVQSVQDFFRFYPNFSTSCISYPMRGNYVLDVNTEFCFNEQVYQACPEDYPDADVKDACENINLIFEGYYSIDKATQGKRLYKNPFCLACSGHQNVHTKPTSLKRFSSSIGPEDKCSAQALTFDFDLIQRPYNFRVRKIAFSARAWTEAWGVFSCAFVRHRKEPSGLETASSSKLLPAEGALATTCRLDSCVTTYMNSCQAVHIFNILYPPAKESVSTDHLNLLLGKWTQFLLHNIPGTGNHTIEEVTFSQTFSKPLVQLGLTYSYRLVVGIYTYVDSATMMLHLLPPRAKYLLTSPLFPFRNDMRYVCLAIDGNTQVNGLDPNHFTCGSLSLMRVPMADGSADHNACPSLPRTLATTTTADSVSRSFLLIVLHLLISY